MRGAVLPLPKFPAGGAGRAWATPSVHLLNEFNHCREKKRCQVDQAQGWFLAHSELRAARLIPINQRNALCFFSNPHSFSKYKPVGLTKDEEGDICP